MLIEHRKIKNDKEDKTQGLQSYLTKKVLQLTQSNKMFALKKYSSVSSLCLLSLDPSPLRYMYLLDCQVVCAASCRRKRLDRVHNSGTN